VAQRAKGTKTRAAIDTLDALHPNRSDFNLVAALVDALDAHGRR
jgi:hypothetical protein